MLRARNLVAVFLVACEFLVLVNILAVSTGGVRQRRKSGGDVVVDVSSHHHQQQQKQQQQQQQQLDAEEAVQVRSLNSVVVPMASNVDDDLKHFEVAAILSGLRPLPDSRLEAAKRFVSKVEVRSDARLLVVVVSKHKNLFQRKFIREAWASPKLQSKLNYQVVFLVGHSRHKNKYTSKVNKERSTYGDLLEADFVDDYRNLTLKSLSLLSFVREQMSSSPDLAMVLKVDDDVLVDPFALRDLLEEEESGRQQDGFMCRVNRNATVDRKESSKWFVKYSEWPGDPSSSSPLYFPPYCDGPAYLFPPAVAKRVLDTFEGLRPRPFFWLEDIFVTGILSRLSGVPLRGLLTPQGFGSVPPHKPWPVPEVPVMLHFAENSLLPVRTKAKMEDAWRKVEERWKLRREEEEEGEEGLVETVWRAMGGGK